MNQSGVPPLPPVGSADAPGSSMGGATMAPQSTALEPWTIGRILTWSTDFLTTRGRTASPRLDAELLLSHALGLSRIQLYTQYDKPLTAAERDPFKEYLRRRTGGEPVAYITGEKEFFSLAFAVDANVLIPRPDTEVLVETVLQWFKGSTGAPRILDVGTGSGCIAIALALRVPPSQVCAWDISAMALTLAKKNAARHGANIAFTRMDALTDAAWEGQAPYFDAIVANPPYISPDEAPQLAASVVDFEPSLALFAPPDGLAFYRVLAAKAAGLLAPGGRVAVEIGSSQAAAVTRLFVAAGWRSVTVRKDYNQCDRVVTAEAPDAT